MYRRVLHIIISLSTYILACSNIDCYYIEKNSVDIRYCSFNVYSTTYRLFTTQTVLSYI